MSDKAKNSYDDGNIPDIDLPGKNCHTTNCHRNSSNNCSSNGKTRDFNKDPLPEPLPESTRPRQDGPGGN